MKRPFRAAIVLLALTAACQKALPENENPAVPVTVGTVGRSDVAEVLSLRGRLVSSPAEDATLAPQVAGRLVTVNAREGDGVAAGALLATVEREPLEEAERSAAAALSRARQEEGARERATALTAKLVEKGIASAEERDADRTAYEGARAARVEAEARLSQATRQSGWAKLQAPFAGVVAQLFKHPGEVVDGTAATPVLRLLGTSVQEVSVEATGPELSRVKAGDEAFVSGPGTASGLRGKVVRVARSVDPATGAGEARVRLLERTAAPLLSSMSVSVVVALHKNVVAVPMAALRRSEAGVMEVVLLEKGIAKARPVKTGLGSSGQVEILEGLSGGEAFVLDNPLGLRDGTPLVPRGEKGS